MSGGDARPRGVGRRTGNVIRDALHRTTGLLLALLFVGGLAGQAYGVRPCPHHLRDAGEHAAHGPASAGAEGVHDHGGETEGHDPGGGTLPHHAAPSGGASVGTPASGAHGGPCTCVGSCLAGPASVLLPRTPVVPEPEAAGPEAVAPRAYDRHRTTSAYLLPFANGPPSLLP